jgi:Protein of unknown function (DUF2563)
MHANTDGLHAGANQSYSAADHADAGHGALSRNAVAAGIFGDFDAAHSFHEAASNAHTQHVTRLKHHIDRLGVVGDKAHRAGADFREMDDQNKQRLTL